MPCARPSSRCGRHEATAMGRARVPGGPRRRDGRPDRPGGTLALRRLLAGMGHQVRDADAPPQGPAVFVLLADLRGPEEADDLMGWARTGGTLVIAAPSS